MPLEAFISKLDVDDSLFGREKFLSELGKSASREELNEFVDQLKRSCSSLKTERISFINDKIGERIDEISGDFENVKSPIL